MRFRLTQDTNIHKNNDPKMNYYGISINDIRSFDSCDEFGIQKELQYEKMRFAFIDSETKEAWKGDIEIGKDGTELAVVRRIK